MFGFCCEGSPTAAHFSPVPDLVELFEDEGMVTPKK